MSRNDIYEQVRRADFNRTEPETLSKLVENAIRIGDEIKDDYIRLRQLTNDVLELLKQKDILKTRTFSREELSSTSNLVASASDGSFQSVGGADGIWYVPISVSLILFRRGIRGAPEVKVGAHIQRINERDYPNIGAAMETSMLTAEANIIKNWAQECPEGIVHFVDGPAIDPPRIMRKDYVKYRIEALTSCLNKKAFVLSCVKKLLGNFLMEYLDNISHDYEKKRMSQFA
jgi:hypothetical protein